MADEQKPAGDERDNMPNEGGIWRMRNTEFGMRNGSKRSTAAYLRRNRDEENRI